MPGILPILRRCFMGHQDAIVLIFHHHDTMIRTQRIVAVHMTLRDRDAGKQLPQHLLWRGQLRANISNPASLNLSQFVAAQNVQNR